MTVPAKDGRFQPGQSGNPNGRPKIVAEVRELARENSTKVITTLMSIVDDPTQPAQARVAAGNSVLDRAFGKPAAAIDLTHGPRAFDGISEDELVQLIAEIRPLIADRAGGTAE